MAATPYALQEQFEEYLRNNRIIIWERVVAHNYEWGHGLGSSGGTDRGPNAR
ncbi:MAG: hypothetical protein SV775_17785 [Thermodesulfobacteriota bacterium]|nr:hypothetical protein [Thermodesulfobacteriota bacterium]